MFTFIVALQLGMKTRQEMYFVHVGIESKQPLSNRKWNFIEHFPDEGARPPPEVVWASLLVACTFRGCDWVGWLDATTWPQVFSGPVESGQPHSICLLSAAARAALCFSISCVTIASTVSAV